MAAHPHLRLVAGGLRSDLLGIHSHDTAIVIDCAVCVMQDTEVCDDCVVSYLVGHEAGTPVVLDAQERRAVDLLAEAGLVPASRFDPRPGVA